MPRRKLHWTQTQRGRRIMRRNARRKHRLARETQTTAVVATKGAVRHEPEAPCLDTHVAYLFGKVETLVEYYASSNGLSYAALATGVSRLLHHHERGKVVGA
jgi:hypothetical protein